MEHDAPGLFALINARLDAPQPPTDPLQVSVLWQHGLRPGGLRALRGLDLDLEFRARNVGIVLLLPWC